MGGSGALLVSETSHLVNDNGRKMLIHGVVAAILSSVFLFSLDQTIVADVQPDIVNHFHAVSQLPWLSVSLLLGAAATNLFW